MKPSEVRTNVILTEIHKFATSLQRCNSNSNSNSNSDSNSNSNSNNVVCSNVTVGYNDSDTER